MSQPFADALNWVPKARALAQTLSRAHDFARAHGHRTVGLEHLLLSLVEDPDAAGVLAVSGVELEALSGDVTGHLAALATEDGSTPVADDALLRILEYAVAAAQQSKRRDVNGGIVLAAIVGEGKSEAAGILRHHGMTFQAAIEAIKSSSRLAPAAPAMPAAPLPVQLPVARTAAEHAQALGADEISDAATTATEVILARARQRVGALQHPVPVPVWSPPAAPVPADSEDAPAAPADEDGDTSMGSEVAAPAAENAAQETVAQAFAEAEAEVVLGPAALSAEAIEYASPPVPPQPAPEPPVAPRPSASWLPPSPIAPVAAAPRVPVRGPPPIPPLAPGHGPPPLPPAANDANGHAGAADVSWSDAARSGRGSGLSELPSGRRPGRPAGDGGTGARRNAREPQTPGGIQEAAIRRLLSGRLLAARPRLSLGKPAGVEVHVPWSEILAAAGAKAANGAAVSLWLHVVTGSAHVASTSPETVWISAADYSRSPEQQAVWTWNVEPLRRGRVVLHLEGAVRALGRDGFGTEMMLPGESVESRVGANHLQAARKLVVMTAVAGGAMVLDDYADPWLQTAVNMLQKLIGTP